MKKIKVAKQLLIVAILFGTLSILGGCGGIGSGDSAGTATGGAVTLSGSVQTPGGTSTFRQTGKAAAAISNVTSATPLYVYALNSAGKTLLTSGNSAADGSFTIAMPAGISLSDYNISVEAKFGANTMRALISNNSGIVLSPVSEATYEIIEQRLTLSNKTIETISRDEIESIRTAVAAATAGVDYSSAASISDAVGLAKNAASADAAVTSAITTAIQTAAPVYYAVYTTSDYSSGKLAAVRLDGSPGLGVSVNTNLPQVFTDAMAVAGERYVYVLNRLGADNVQVIDPRNGFTTVANYSTGNKSNPYDIEELSATKAYVTRYGAASILIVNPATGAELGTIDLSQFADADGIPEMSEMVKVGTKVFVTLQKLSNYSPSAAGLLAVIDTATDSLIDVNPAAAGTQAVTLNCWNPGYIDYIGTTGKLYVSCSGSYFDASVPSGIDEVDAATYAVRTLVTGATLGGAPGDLQVVSSTKGYVIVSGANWMNYVKAFNPTTGSLIGNGTVYTAGGYVPALGMDPFGNLLISDTGFSNPGVVFLSTSNNTVVAGPVSTGLPPMGVAIIAVPQ